MSLCSGELSLRIMDDYGYKWLGEVGEVSSGMTRDFHDISDLLCQTNDSQVKEGLEFWKTTCKQPVLYVCVQEAFFGKDLLDKSKHSRQQGVESGLLEEGQSQVERKHHTTSFLDSSSDPLLSASSSSLQTRPTTAGMNAQSFSSSAQGCFIY